MPCDNDDRARRSFDGALEAEPDGIDPEGSLRVHRAVVL